MFSTCTALGKRGLEATDCVAGTAGLLAITGAVTGAAGAIGGMPGLATWGGIPINKKNCLLLQPFEFFPLITSVLLQMHKVLVTEYIRSKQQKETISF